MFEQTDLKTFQTKRLNQSDKVIQYFWGQNGGRNPSVRRFCLDMKHIAGKTCLVLFWSEIYQALKMD